MKCLLCNNEFKTHQSFCLHLRSHKTTICQYTKNVLNLSDSCIICGNPTKYQTKKRKFARFCSQKCAHKSEETKKRRVELSLQRYGVTSPAKLPFVVEKRKQTCLKKYGVECNFNLPETRKNTLESISKNRENITAKTKATNMEKYGVECTLHSKNSIKEKKKTWIKHWGVDNPNKSDFIREKKKQTCLKRYGVESPLLSTEILEKAIKSNMEKYGVPYPSQNTIVHKKILKSLFRSKPYALPSGKIIKLLGYESSFLDYVFRKKLLHEDEINYSPTRIQYIGYDGKTHYYFPDFYITKWNLLIEVKSEWTEKQDKNLLFKEHACKEQGYSYIRIVNNNFEKFAELCNQKLGVCS